MNNKMCNYSLNNLHYNLINNLELSDVNDIELNLYYKKNNYTQFHLFQISILLAIYYYSFLKIIILYI